MFISAYWHGIHPGYFLSMLTTVPCMIAEDLLAKAFRDNRSPSHQQAFDWFVWFLRCRSFDYMSMGFMLLTLQSTCRYWGSVYYIGHVWTVLFIAIGYVCRPRSKGKQGKEDGVGDVDRSAGDKKTQ